MNEVFKRRLAEIQDAKLEKEHFAREAEERRLQKEAEKRRFQKEMEETQLEREMEEKRLEREQEAKLQSEKLAARLELERLQLKRARLERGSIEARAEIQSAASSQAGQDNVAAVTKSPGLPGFVDGKDNLDNYLLRFERFATIAGWQRDTWAVRFSPLLTGKALDVYSGLSSKDARDYEKMRKALLQRYDFTEQGYRERFSNAKAEGQESPGQLIVRIRNYFNKWVELSEVGFLKTFEGVKKLMVCEQCTTSCPRDVSIFSEGAETSKFGGTGLDGEAVPGCSQ